jgi:hypothetical protein
VSDAPADQGPLFIHLSVNHDAVAGVLKWFALYVFMYTVMYTLCIYVYFYVYFICIYVYFYV